MDRGVEPAHVDQGGQEVPVAGRKDFTAYTRTVADIDYLSSYAYRQAFTENFFQAVASQIRSIAFITHERDGITGSARFARYQNFLSVNEGQEVRILHLPSADAEVDDHALGNTRMYYGLESSAAGLDRSQPGFNGSPIGRFDLHPHISLPLVFDGATLRPSVGLRET